MLRFASFIALDTKEATRAPFLSPPLWGKENRAHAGMAQRVRDPIQPALDPSQRAAFVKILSGIDCL
jgi:hypothetical protein